MILSMTKTQQYKLVTFFSLENRKSLEKVCAIHLKQSETIPKKNPQAEKTNHAIDFVE